MIKRTHIVTTQLITCGSYVALASLTNAPKSTVVATLIPLLVGSHYGAQFPDIDQKSTDISRNTGVFGKWVCNHLEHRTYTHTLWAVLLYAAVWIGSEYMVSGWLHTLICPLLFGFMVGNLLHLIEDNFSVMGVCFLYPLHGKYLTGKNGKSKYKSTRGYSKYRYRVNGAFETILYYVLSVVLIGLYVYVFKMYII